MEVVTDFLFLISKITADGDGNHEIRFVSWEESCDKPRQCVEKQRHYSAENVCIVKAMIFPVATYGCESWMVKKGSAKELMPSNCGVGEDS